MRVASCVEVIAETRSLTASGCVSRYARPRSSSSARERIQSPSLSTPAASTTTTWRRFGRSARRSTALASWAASSAMRTFDSESERMNADSSALVCG